MDAFEERDVEDPAEQGRGANTKRQQRKGYGCDFATRQL